MIYPQLPTALSREEASDICAFMLSVKVNPLGRTAPGIRGVRLSEVLDWLRRLGSGLSLSWLVCVYQAVSNLRKLIMPILATAVTDFRPKHALALNTI